MIFLVLNDESYNQNRHASTGSRFKEALNGLMQKSAQLELCSATAKGNDWGNANLLPGVKVNINAMVRLTQLEGEGYTLIYQYRKISEMEKNRGELMKRRDWFCYWLL
jgi:intracellular sulfur oxidation DsrE/DsrF family protein